MLLSELLTMLTSTVLQWTRMDIFLTWLVLCRELSVCSTQELPKVTIVTPGYAGFQTLPSLNYIGPAIDTAMDYIKRTYGETLDFNHIYLSNANSSTCLSFTDSVQYLLADWYYTYTYRQSKGATEVIAVVTSACIDSSKISQLAASWNILLVTR